MAGAEKLTAEQLTTLTADLADQHGFRQMLGFLAHHNRQGAPQGAPQEAPREDAAFAEEPTEEGKEIAGGGASRQVNKGYFERFCDRVERTLKHNSGHNLAANQPGKESADVEPICIVDFAFGDEKGLNLQGSDQLLERAYCFIDRHDPDRDTRLLVLHVHTMRKWSEAKRMHPRDRVQKVTSECEACESIGKRRVVQAGVRHAELQSASCKSQLVEWLAR